LKHVALAATTLILLYTLRFWILRIRDLLEGWIRVPTIDPHDQVHQITDWPLISVLVPAHNEAAGIQECLRTVLDQDYPNFELVFVDDRSSDATFSLAAELLEGKPNCRLVQVSDLPGGWTGKCHALHEGMQHARGQWLAFLDADSKLHPRALRQCFALARRQRVSMITLSPRFLLESFWERALVPAFASVSCMLFPLSKVNDPNSPVASANGMFYLISREAYLRIGGHRDVRDLAVEDIGIGKRVKAMGMGLVFANGRNVLETRMYTNFRETVRGWMRILSASMNYEISLVLRLLAEHVVLSAPSLVVSIVIYSSLAGEVFPTFWFLLPAACLLAMAVVPCFFYRQLGVPVRYSGLLALGNFILVGSLAVMVKKIRCKDRLQWRGTTYNETLYEPTRLDPTSLDLYPASAPQVLEKAN
jgi:chlorobactene glucosyltransferase